ncbi:ATP:cob(I)alamin adenosyltransferase, partial [Oligoflexia bacterium]|nr:ATP:cob(I)alamin adenosyltransferase [Oligoflexia bacterium]
DPEASAKISLSEEDITQLEGWIEECTAQVPDLTSFVLPGGTLLNAALHQCRTICRRAERSAIALSNSEAVSPLAVKYLNRLSDLFFALARFDAQCAGATEYLWEPRKGKNP